MNKIFKHGKAFIFAAAMVFTFFVSQSSAQYVQVDDDYLNASTAQAVLDGSFNNYTAGLVRWYYDGAIKMGEIKGTTLARARTGYNPRCIATRVRWQDLSVTGVSFSLPVSTSITLGFSTTSDGYRRSCRSSSSTTPPQQIPLTGASHSTRFIWRLHVDICHLATALSEWSCHTDSNEYGAG